MVNFYIFGRAAIGAFVFIFPKYLLPFLFGESIFDFGKFCSALPSMPSICLSALFGLGISFSSYFESSRIQFVSYFYLAFLTSIASQNLAIWDKFISAVNTISYLKWMFFSPRIFFVTRCTTLFSKIFKETRIVSSTVDTWTKIFLMRNNISSCFHSVIAGMTHFSDETSIARFVRTTNNAGAYILFSWHDSFRSFSDCFLFSIARSTENV